MMNAAEPSYMAVDGDVVWRVGKDHLSLFPSDQHVVSSDIKCASTNEAMGAKAPNVAGA